MRNLLEKIFGDESSRTIRSIQPLVTKINDLEASFSILTDEECREKTQEFRARLAAGESTDDILPEAFALVREAAKRAMPTPMRH